MIDWPKVKRVLVVKLRSIGDTVLTTPSLIALRRFLPDARIDILLEDWVAPLLDGFEAVDDVISLRPGPLLRLSVARELRRRRYDVAFNLHGGTTATFFIAATRARHRVGLSVYQYSFLYNHLFPSPAEFWKSEKIHSTEQQLALLGFVGVPVGDRPKSRLAVTDAATRSIGDKLSPLVPARTPLALMHPAASSFTKQWEAGNFARTAEFLADRGFQTVAIASAGERGVLERLKHEAKVPVVVFDDLTLPEITALAAKAGLFVGNDSGIAHMAAAVNTPSVVIFGSSNRTHWRPWTDAPNEIVFTEFYCQPCPGYECREFGEPKCILSVAPEAVFAAIDRVLEDDQV